MKYVRQLKYYYLRFIGLRGEPHELALGMALGVFSGMLPIVPFQIALAVAIALLLKASKITAALGTWISNPLNWYFTYLYAFKIGAYILGMKGGSGIIRSVIDSISRGHEVSVIWGKLFSSGFTLVSAMLIGGAIMGIVAAIPTYFIFLRFFLRIRRWRQRKRTEKSARSMNSRKSRIEE